MFYLRPVCGAGLQQANETTERTRRRLIVNCGGGQAEKVPSGGRRRRRSQPDRRPEGSSASIPSVSFACRKPVSQYRGKIERGVFRHQPYTETKLKYIQPECQFYSTKRKKLSCSCSINCIYLTRVCFAQTHTTAYRRLNIYINY